MSKQILTERNKQIEILEQKLEAYKRRLGNKDRVEAATSDTYTWVTQFTQTYNEHWVEEGRPSPYEPFPPHEYFQYLFDVIDYRRIVFIEKSRDLMISWSCVAYFTLQAMRVAHRGVVFQTQKYDKAIDLVEYAKCLYRRQSDWLRDAFPLAKPLDSQPKDCLEFADGGYVLGIPGGRDQLRGHHPWGYFNDETSFQPEAGECYNEALSAVKGKIVLNSSRDPDGMPTSDTISSATTKIECHAPGVIFRQENRGRDVRPATGRKIAHDDAITLDGDLWAAVYLATISSGCCPGPIGPKPNPIKPRSAD